MDSMSSNMATVASTENIQVCFRVRPLDRRERAANEQVAWEIDTKNAIMTRRVQQKQGKEVAFPCAHLLDENSTTEELYERQVRDKVESSLQGINGSVFCYGQTASGKTHTMKGHGDTEGIIHLALRQLFGHIAASDDTDFLIRVQYLEVYNEKIKDLLNPQAPPDLTLHENKQRGVYVNAKEEIVTSEAEIISIIHEGETRRHYGQTDMNDLSSRSHTILRIMIESKPKSSVGFMSPRKTPQGKRIMPKVKSSILTFVDLAGSERLAQTGSKIGSSTQKEGSFINKSLLFLGVIISRLSEGEKEALPYRESKLTRLLQCSLGGNSRTVIICTVSPATSNVEQTVSTLRFGARAIRIKNHATVNEIHADQAFINQHQNELEQRRLSTLHDGMDERMQQEVLNEQLRLKADLESQLANLKLLILQSTHSQINQDINSTPIRRHTLGATPHRMKSESDLDGSDDAFRSEQLTCQKNRIEQLEGLLSELSAENQELLNRESHFMETEEELVQQQEQLTNENHTMSQQLSLITSGAGLASLSHPDLVALEDSLQQSIKRVQRAMYFAEFTTSFGPQTTVEVVVPASIDTSVAPAEIQEDAKPTVEQLQQALEESASQADAMKGEIVLQQGQLEQWQHQWDKQQQLEAEKLSAVEAAHSESIHALKQAIEAEMEILRQQNYKFSKQLLAQQQTTSVETSSPLTESAAGSSSANENAINASVLTREVKKESANNSVTAQGPALSDRTNFTQSSSLANLLQIKQQPKSGVDSKGTKVGGSLLDLINQLREFAVQNRMTQCQNFALKHRLVQEESDGVIQPCILRLSLRMKGKPAPHRR